MKQNDEAGGVSTPPGFESQDALLESQTTLEAIIESTSDMVWSVDRKSFGLLTFNRSFRDFYYQRYGVKVARGMCAEERVPTGALLEDWRGFYRRALVEGPFTTEYTLAAGTGVLQLTFGLLQRDGRVFGISVFGNDITRRKRAEERLQRQIAFEELVSQLLAGFANANCGEIDHQIRASLQALAGFMGVEQAHVIRVSADSRLWSVTHEWARSDREAVKERYQDLPFGTAPWVEARLLAGKTVQIDGLEDFPPEAEAERRRHLEEGIRSSLRVPLRGRAGLFHGCLGLFAFSREVAWGQEDIRWVRILSDAIAHALERKLTEEALRESEARFRALIEKAPIAIGMARGGLHLYANPKLLDMFGFQSFEQLRGKPVTQQWAPVAREMVADYARRREAGQPAPSEFEGTGMRQDGSEFLAHVAVTSVQLADGPASLAFLTDITDRVQAEESLRRSGGQLRALWARLQSLREEERTRIAREIHDHLGQLLTALKLDLRSLGRRIAKVPGPELRKTLGEKLASATGLADEMIGSVQAIAAELRPGILDRLGLAAAIEAEAVAFGARTGIVCETALPAELGEISQDQTTAVFRVFQELLTNVARHAQARRVTVRLSRDKELLVLEVKDDGAGIRPGALQDPKSLGLLGMRERAATLGGEIAFTAEPGRGTTARLQIPQAATAGKDP